MIGALSKTHENPLNYLYRYITKCCFQYSQSPILRVFQLFLIIQVPAIVFVAIINIIFSDRVASTIENGTAELIMITIVSPAIETLMIALGYGICHSFSVSKRRTLAINAIFFALIHGFLNPVRFIPALWAFLFFCSAYQIGNTQSFARGFFLSFTLHATCNSLVIAIYLCTIR
ncbi:hypothetical protein Q4561_11535 [Alteromonas sp. 1_MG-2023]|uniref:hypothetical protein n=1 Tax=Alteromonas sp. 1_MG-2023 TaxID=3062669 RepID=UPI0026E1882B|nr:hypothetical protein [Alteromonas sp. 1_MG-2023]MDO6567691.1 hypothetical protein [Alteromonas sp. 1_MG-2023]